MALAAGDPIAATVIKTTGRYLGVGVADLINLYNPQVIVFSSWVAELLGPYLLPEVRTAAARYALPRPFAATEITLCSIDHNPVSLGAATFALERFLATVGLSRA
jgi:predicted NBD/HSP70 family sugar kinase